MRSVSLFIVVYILFLLTQPCQDVFAAYASGEGERIAAAASPQMPGEVPGETCSPFCICSCCGLSVGYHSNVLIAEPKQIAHVIQTIRVEYSDPAVNNFSGSIWQPPKL